MSVPVLVDHLFSFFFFLSIYFSIHSFIVYLAATVLHAMDKKTNWSWH